MTIHTNNWQYGINNMYRTYTLYIDEAYSENKLSTLFALVMSCLIIAPWVITAADWPSEKLELVFTYHVDFHFRCWYCRKIGLFRLSVCYFLSCVSTLTRGIDIARRIKSCIWSIERCHFQWPWKTLNPVFKVTLFFESGYITNG